MKDSSRITCTVATTPEDMDHVYRLRYLCYWRRGAISERGDRRFRDEFDALPNHFSFLARQEGGEPVATVRVSVVRPDLGWGRAPACKVFGDHPGFERVSGSFVEASRLCFGLQARRDVLFRLIANLAALGDLHQADWLVACPRTEHSGMYQRLFGFRRLAPARKYFGVSFETELLAVRREQLRTLAEGNEPIRRAWNSAVAASADRGILIPDPESGDREEGAWRRLPKRATSPLFYTASATGTMSPGRTSSTPSITS